MLLQKFIEIFFPSHCICCDKIISKNAAFCEECWPQLEFISEPKCRICSYPFEVEIASMKPLCSRCLIKKPSYEKALTIFRYGRAIRKAIGDLKYRDQTFLAKKFSQILQKKFAQEINDCDFLITVPLHLKRLRKRKFNQANLIAKNLNRKKFIADFLWRVVETKPQVELRRKQREGNLKRAFLINKKYRDLVKGKKFLLLDDVMTTGATLENCAKILKKKGAKEVVVMTIAKTVIN